MQSQKFTSVVESMQRGETLVALKTISTLISKEKNKAKLSETELKLILVLKALCLSKIHEYGESLAIVTEFLKTEKDFIITESNVLRWLDYIASSVHIYKEVREFSSNIYNKAGNKEEHLLEYMNLCIKEYNYHEIFSSALRLYKLTNNPKYMFVNVFYQYKAMSNSGVEPKKLEIVYLFTEKLMKEIKVYESKELDRIQAEAVKFAVEICISGTKKHEKALELLQKYHNAFNDNMEYLNWFYTLEKELKTEDIRLLLINQHFLRFQKDQDLDNFVMEFLIYEHFIAYLFAPLESCLLPLEAFEAEEKSVLFETFHENKKNCEVLTSLLRSLFAWKKRLAEKKSNRNYKFALQICISALLSTLKKLLLKTGKEEEKQKMITSEKIQELLKEYVENFGNTLTFYEEIQRILEHIEPLFVDFVLKAVEGTVDKENKVSRWIKEISILKLRIWRDFEAKMLSELDKILPLIKYCIENYFQSFADLDLEHKSLEKGERHFSDEFLVMAADLGLILISFTHEAISPDSLEILLDLIILLEASLMKSPYNFDIKTRLLLFYDILACPEHSIEIIRTMDIKSVQHETLGFFYAKIYLNYQNISLTQDLFTGALNFYSENLRESKESMLACVKSLSFSRINEFEEYDKFLDNSYFKQICYFAKLDSLLKQQKHEQSGELNINYFLSVLSQKLEDPSKLTWNIDGNVLNPCFLPKKQLFSWSFLDIFNSFELFSANFSRVNLENLIKSTENIEKMEKSLVSLEEMIKTIEKAKFDDFSRFQSRNEKVLASEDRFKSAILLRKRDFELLNLKLEKGMFAIFVKCGKFKQEESYVEGVFTELKELDLIMSTLTSNFLSSLSTKDLSPCFPKETLFYISRFINKTIETVLKYCKALPDLLPILSKAAKKSEEDLKKRTNALHKALMANLREVVEFSIKNLGSIQEFLQIVYDCCAENQWGKKLRTLSRGNKELIAKELWSGSSFKLETTEKMVIWSLMNEYSMYAALNLSNVKELVKMIKGLKI